MAGEIDSNLEQFHKFDILCDALFDAFIRKKNDSESKIYRRLVYTGKISKQKSHDEHVCHYFPHCANI